MNEQNRVSCPLLRDVFFADLQLVRDRKQRCWSRDVSEVLECLGVQASLATNLAGGTGEPRLCMIDMEEVIRAAFQKLMGPWAKNAECDPRELNLPVGCGRKMVTYAQWMAAPWEAGRKPPMHPYLSCALPKNVWRNVARFRTSSHHLSIETGRWRRPLPIPVCERLCGNCEANVAQDERHVLLECSDPRLCGIRMRYPALFEMCEDDMRSLMQAEDAKGMSWFVHECMQLIDADYMNSEEETASSLIG